MRLGALAALPGTIKAALDWLAGSTDIVEKPVALLSGSARSTHAQESVECPELDEHGLAAQSCERLRL